MAQKGGEDMKQMIVDIVYLSDEYMKQYDLYNRYRIKAYVYATDSIISYGVNEKDIQDYQIGKIINNSLI